jgi:hypothetical protein
MRRTRPDWKLFRDSSDGWPSVVSRYRKPTFCSGEDRHDRYRNL